MENVVNLTLAICMYNAERFISETLQSVMNQTMQAFDILIIDDCSTDNSVQLVNKFFDNNPRQYKLVRLEENRGICHARHYAERNAQTPFMMFLDADDILLPKAIEKMYKKIEEDDDLMAVGCYLDYIDKNGKKIGGGLYLGEKNKEDFIDKASRKKLIFMQPTAIYRREYSLKVGGYIIDGYPQGKPRWQDYCEDLDLWTRMSDLYKEGKAIVVIPETLCLYRKSTGLSSNSFYMILKMKYTKSNLLRRREGMNDLTFEDYYSAIPEAELKKIKREAKSADALRNGVFLIKDGNPFKGAWQVLYSVLLNPSYIFEKIKNNLVK
ncbi:MAG: glycosyltransferase family 2 protein [Paludibacteraceae bacterium]|nr:glycosyltransferase family 2 protein [Paludibacteraceae bacterium]